MPYEHGRGLARAQLHPGPQPAPWRSPRPPPYAETCPSVQVNKIRGKRTRDHAASLGYNTTEEVVHRWVVVGGGWGAGRGGGQGVGGSWREGKVKGGGRGRRCSQFSQSQFSQCAQCVRAAGAPWCCRENLSLLASCEEDGEDGHTEDDRCRSPGPGDAAAGGIAAANGADAELASQTQRALGLGG
jgi:hypothetical protein